MTVKSTSSPQTQCYSNHSAPCLPMYACAAARPYARSHVRAHHTRPVAHTASIFLRWSSSFMRSTSRCAWMAASSRERLTAASPPKRWACARGARAPYAHAHVCVHARVFVLSSELERACAQVCMWAATLSPTALWVAGRVRPPNIAPLTACAR